MIEFASGDILNDDSEALVNTVNCVGVMGRGIALQFKNAWPENFDAYALACRKQEVRPGSMFVFETRSLTTPKYIVNFPTKRHWRGASRMEDIESGLVDLVNFIKAKKVLSVAIPPLGSGLGGLDWDLVSPKIVAAMSELTDVKIRIYEPKGAPTSDKMVRSSKVPDMTAGRAALIELMHRYLAGLLDPFVTLLEVHKLMYFMQEAGEPLHLKFKAAHYGPYAENLRHVLREMEGYFISGYADGGDAPGKPLQLVAGAIEQASTFLSNHAGTRTRFDQVAELVDGFESPFGLELLSSVHWIMKRHLVETLDDVVAYMHDWNPHKKQFTPRQIDIAVEVLTRKGWAGLPHSAV